MTKFEKLVRDVKACQNLITGIRNYRNLLEKQDLTKTEKDSLKDDFDFNGSYHPVGFDEFHCN